jgi:hypothetical protein
MCGLRLNVILSVSKPQNQRYIVRDLLQESDDLTFLHVSAMPYTWVYDSIFECKVIVDLLNSV